MIELDDPPGYFRVARTGRMHLVRRVVRVTRWNGGSHLSIEFWCANISSAQQGELLMKMPPDATECVGCLKIRYRKLPRLQG